MTKLFLPAVAALLCLSPFVFADEDLPVDLSGKAASFKNAHKIFRESCMPCHSAQIPIPWYGHLPVAKQLMKKEYRDAIDDLDLDSEVYVSGQAPSLATLNKVQRVIEKGKMPPLSYRMSHPKSRLSKQEKQMILDWIRDERLKTQSPAAAAQSLPVLVSQTAASVAGSETEKSVSEKHVNPFKPFNS